ncbi:hypothetical protein JTB14_034112 [Gonioctena quinquepunctata]|nr:hypothetical protein JTB14_034112 [Gonioctena quinquepunctata]
MNAALEAVARGIPVATAAKIHSITRVTLMYKSSGRLPTECRMGPSTVLTTNEEDLLEKWILSLAKVYHPVNKEQLLDSVHPTVTQNAMSPVVIEVMRNKKEAEAVAEQTCCYRIPKLLNKR